MHVAQNGIFCTQKVVFVQIAQKVKIVKNRQNDIIQYWLARSIPMLVEELEEVENADGEKIAESGLCPHCEDYILPECHRFCPHCGQRLDWSEVR